MKSIVLVVLAILFFCSCGKEEVKVQYVTVTGNIISPGARDIIIYEGYSFWDDPKTLDSVILDENNYFKMRIPLSEEGMFYIYTGDKYVKYIYLCPEDSLNLKIDTSTDDNYEISYSGRGKSVKGNRLKDNFYKTFKRDDDYWSSVRGDDYRKFIKYVDSLKQKQLEFYKKNFWNNDAPEIEKNNMLDEINYNWAYLRVDYLLENHYWNDESKMKIDSSDFFFLNEINLDNPKSNISPNFNYFISRYLDLLKAKTNYKKEKNNKDELFYSKQKYDIAKKMFSGVAKDIAITESIKDVIDWEPSLEGMKLARIWLDDLKKNATDTTYAYLTEKKYNERMKLMPGRPAPGFRMPTIDGDTISLSDFKGKLVYIDFWGTWCGPCRQEIPYYDTLQNKFKNNPNIIFISLAMEYQRYNEWKQFVKEKKLPGIHIYLEKQFRNELAVKYMIRGVPTFVLIDKKGLIINANAPRPSADNIVEYINKYIN
ncbi:MAG: redoxin domain-containing protein [Ignavibacteriae bacterium]|nr:redoxin domain-containing protein [Ignavibacteriota bacterium]